MPNVNFDRHDLPHQFGSLFNSSELNRRLRSIKAELDDSNDNALRIRFSDSLRPDLWCAEGLIRCLEPGSHHEYGLSLIIDLQERAIAAEPESSQVTTWILYVDVPPGCVIRDDGPFLVKVNDVIGFESRLLQVSAHATEQLPRIDSWINECDENADHSLVLDAGPNTVIIRSVDQRVCTWFALNLICNYVDRGYKPLGFSSTAQDRFSMWAPFVIDSRQVRDILGYQPSAEKFEAALQNQHYKVEFDSGTEQWQIAPPIFRFDVIHPIDIVEDYLAYTYYEDASVKTLGSEQIGCLTSRTTLEERLVEYLTACGALETIGVLLDSHENVVNRMCHHAPHRVLRVSNPVNSEHEYFIDSTLPALLRNAAHESVPDPPLMFYIFSDIAFVDQEKYVHTSRCLGVLLIGTKSPFNDAHSVLHSICSNLGVNYEVQTTSYPALIPGRQFEIVSDRRKGLFGEVHPEVLTRWRLGHPTSFIELDLDSFTSIS